MVRWLSFVAAFVLLSAPWQTDAGAATPFEINAILSRTGSGAFIGNTEAEALGVLEGLVNKHGGINGQPIKFNITDDQTNPSISVQLANAIISKGVPIMLGSSLSSMCNGIAPLVEKTGPVDYCFSPGMHGPPGGFIFSAGAGTDAIAVVEARFFRQRGYTRVALLNITDSSGQEHHGYSLAALGLSENKRLQIVADESFNPNDVSVAAQMSRIKASHAQALITAASGSAFGTILRSFRDSGMEIPLSSSAGNMVPAQMAQYKAFAPKELYFVATHGVAPDPTRINGPVHDAERAYFDAFKAAGVQPSYLASLAWDPASLVVDAFRHLGPNASADQLHRYLEGSHGWAGINGIYDFRDNSQRGIAQNALAVYRWNPDENTFLVTSIPAGHVK